MTQNETKLWIVMKENKRFFYDLGIRIVKQRKNLGITQSELGDLIGVTQQVIASYETAKRQIPAWRVPILAQALGMTLDDIMGVGDHTAKRGPKSKIERQLDKVKELPKSEQQFVSQFLEKILVYA